MVTHTLETVGLLIDIHLTAETSDGHTYVRNSGLLIDIYLTTNS